ncbi:MAG TPA: hypothetical protein VHG28_01650 [Longimicrobiaceae bacterium]|nr:hypothetical protein [Longimicrobiaceae bacterium]
MPPTRIPTPAQLRRVRYALLAGPLLFGAVVFWLRWQGQPTAKPEVLTTFRLASYGLCFVVLAALLAIRRIRAGRPEGERGTWSLVGWALAEATALFGGVFLLMGGDPWPYATGLLLILGSWSLIPADPAEI